MDKWFFSHSPSLYAILSGALIGVGINLLTGLLLSQEKIPREKYFSWATFCFLISAVLFAWISTILERIREESSGSKDLLTKIYDNRIILRLLIFISFGSVLMGIFLLK